METHGVLDWWFSYFYSFSCNGICNQSSSFPWIPQENTLDLERIVAALDAEMALKGLYRLPQEDIQAVVISQNDGKCTVYLINTCRMSISAEPRSLPLHSDRQEWQGTNPHGASCLPPYTHCTHPHSLKKMLFLNCRCSLPWNGLYFVFFPPSRPVVFFPIVPLQFTSVSQCHTFAVVSHSLLAVWVIDGWLRSHCHLDLIWGTGLIALVLEKPDAI